MANICDYYPCHDPIKGFSCEYCYCPLYESDCKNVGNPKFIEVRKGSIKDCSDCILPHKPEFKKNILDKL
jgi:Zn-finger protein